MDLFGGQQRMREEGSIFVQHAHITADAPCRRSISSVFDEGYPV